MWITHPDTFRSSSYGPKCAQTPCFRGFSRFSYRNSPETESINSGPVLKGSLCKYLPTHITCSELNPLPCIQIPQSMSVLELFRAHFMHAQGHIFLLTSIYPTNVYVMDR